MPTAALYREAPVTAVFEDVLPERRLPEIELLYITDRGPVDNPETALPCGEKRARSLAFGNAVVEMVPSLSWQELVR
jgi:hypothetical protein